MKLKEGSPLPPAYRGQVPLVLEGFLDQIYHRVAIQGRNMIFLFMGDNGTGKSWGAINFARLFDSRFDLNHKLVYEPAEFFDALDYIKYRGEVIVWDEAGVGMNSREWNSLFNKVVSKTLQIFREATPGRIVLIFATPRKIFMDKTARIMLNMEWRFEWPEALLHPIARPYWLKYSIHYRTKTMEDYVIYRLPVVRIGNLEVKIRSLQMGRLPDDLANEYISRSRPEKFRLRFQYALIRALGESFPSDLAKWLYDILVFYGLDKLDVKIFEIENLLPEDKRSYFNIIMHLIDGVVKARRNQKDLSYYTELRETLRSLPDAVKERFARYLIEWIERSTGGGSGG